MASPDGAAPKRRDAVAGAPRMRFDKWLWAARFYRTRALAAQAIAAGQARLANERVRPAHVVRLGDALSVRKQGAVWEVEVTGLADRRGSATEAAALYRESPESVAARNEEIVRRKAAAAAQPRFGGRPSKRNRRKLEDFLSEP